MWPTKVGWEESLRGDIAVDAAAAVWLGSTVTVEELILSSGSITSELTGDQVQSRVSVLAGDPEGTLFTGWEGDKIGSEGHRLRMTTTISAGAWSGTVPVGTFRINSCRPEKSTPWRLYLKTGMWVRGAQTLRVEGGDLLDQVTDERFATPPTAPPGGATLGSEITRLAAGIVPIGLSVSSLSMAVPASITYDEFDRLGSMISLFRAGGTIAMVDRNGVLQAVPSTGSGSEWIVPLDAVIKTTPTSSRDGLSNGWVVTSESETRELLRGQDVESSGVLQWGGPFGRVPKFHNSPVLTTNAACAAAARTEKKRDIAARQRIIEVECGTNPAVEVLDTAVIPLPDRTVRGLVVKTDRPALGRSMNLSVSVDWEEFHG